MPIRDVLSPRAANEKAKVRISPQNTEDFLSFEAFNLLFLKRLRQKSFFFAIMHYITFFVKSKILFTKIIYNFFF